MEFPRPFMNQSRAEILPVLIVFLVVALSLTGVLLLTLVSDRAAAAERARAALRSPSPPPPPEREPLLVPTTTAGRDVENGVGAEAFPAYVDPPPPPPATGPLWADSYYRGTGADWPTEWRRRQPPPPPRPAAAAAPDRRFVLRELFAWPPDAVSESEYEERGLSAISEQEEEEEEEEEGE